jgi:hypothetical protein
VGAPFTVAVSVADRGRSPAAAVGVFLSRDRVHDRGDVRLVGGGRVPAAGARAVSVRVAAQVRVPTGLAPGAYFVIACVDDPSRIRERSERNNCAASVRPLAVTATPVSSSQLLAAAVAAHKLSPQQALVYRVLAAFGDPRLPSMYAGDDSAPDDLVMRAATDAWPTLSVTQKQELRPFFTPPVVSGSWFSPRASAAGGKIDLAPLVQPRCITGPLRKQDWYTLAKPNGHVRLWWLKSDDERIGSKMRPLVYEIENTIWPKLHALMGRQPLSDAGEPCFHGGDGRLDIYLFRFNHDSAFTPRALTFPYPPRCTGAPTFIVFDVGSEPPSRWEVAHELMHSFQYAFHYRGNCDSYSSWDESTATWAGQYVYPHDNEEHFYDIWWPNEPLISESYYGWTFPYAMEMLHGADTIAATYRQAERFPVAQAIDAGMPGGLAKTWPEFALKAWNDDSVAPSFKQWDDYDVQPPGPTPPPKPVPTEMLDTTAAHMTADVPRNLAPLTRSYRHFAVASNVTQVSITQQPAPGIRVDAIERFGDGSTQIEQLQTSRTFCSDDPAKRLADLVLVITNSSLTDTSLANPLELSATDLSCGPIQYRVLSASISEHVSGSATTSSCAAESASTTIAGTSTGPASDDNTSHLAPYGPDQLGGVISGRIEATFTTQESGCKPGAPSQPCSSAGSTVGPESVAFDVVAHPSSGQATLSWTFNGLAFDTPRDPCGIFIYGNLPLGTSTQTVPLAKLLSPDPQTFTLAGSAPLQHVTPAGASLENDWNLSLTVQRR